MDTRLASGSLAGIAELPCERPYRRGTTTIRRRDETVARQGRNLSLINDIRTHAAVLVKSTQAAICKWIARTQDLRRDARRVERAAVLKDDRYHGIADDWLSSISCCDHWCNLEHHLEMPPFAIVRCWTTGSHCTAHRPVGIRDESLVAQRPPSLTYASCRGLLHSAATLVAPHALRETRGT